LSDCAFVMSPLNASIVIGTEARAEMANQSQHGLFFMENAGGYKPAEPGTAPSPIWEEHQPSCFALEEEKGEDWKSSGSTKPAINEARPTL